MTDLQVNKLPDATRGLMEFLCALVVEKGNIIKLPIEKVKDRPPGLLRFEQDDITQEIVCIFVPQHLLPDQPYSGDGNGNRIIVP